MNGFCTQCEIDRGVTLGLIKDGIEVSGRVFIKSGSIITSLQDAYEDPSPTLSYKLFKYRGDNVGSVGGFRLGHN